MSDKLVLERSFDGDKELPVAYIDLISDRDPIVHSVRQVVIEISDLPWKVRELIFDIDKDERVTGVELLG